MSSKEFDINNAKDRETLRRLYKVKRTEGEMMKQRGYRLDNLSVIDFNTNQFVGPISVEGLQNPNNPLDLILTWAAENGIFQSRKSFSSVYENAEGHQVLVLYLENSPGKQVDKKGMNIVRTFVSSGVVNHIIIITETGLNPNNSSEIKDRITSVKIEVFLDKELAFNHLKHVLAPISIRHIKSEDAAKWAAAEGVTRDQLPLIFNTDTISKYYAAKPLDIMEYELLGTNTETMGYYRVVRPAPSQRR